MPPPRWIRNASDRVPSIRGCSADINPMSATWKRAHELGQPFTWIRISSSNPGRRAASSSVSHIARPFVSPIASLQNSMPVHAMVPLRNALGRARRSRSSRRAHQRVGARRIHAADHELLLRGRRDLAVAELVGQVGDDAELVPRDAPRARREPDEHATVPLFVHAHVVAIGERSRRGSRAVGQRTRLQELLLQDLADALGAPVLHQELQPGVVPGAPVAVLAEERGHAGPRVGHPLPARRTRRAVGRTSGSSTGRRRPAGRIRARASGDRRPRTRCR